MINADETLSIDSFAPTPALPCPKISVIIPMYNAEKYIGECLDSVLNQTFQSFEVIIVDDCSTDSSVAVVESYIPKFDGRLRLKKTETNSGGGGVPRNIGLSFAGGEYVFFLDADDVFTKTALEEMYTLAKEFNADVVYCEKYFMSEGVGQEFIDNIHPATGKIQHPPFVDEPTLETENMAERVKRAVNYRYWVTPWLRLVRRKLLLDNNIKFDSLIGSNDFTWTFKVLFCAKRFLRVPNACYIRRIHEESVSYRRRTPKGYIHKWMDLPVRALKDMDNFMGGIEFFRENLSCRQEVLNKFIASALLCSLKECQNLSRAEVYDNFHQVFGEYLGAHDVLVSCLYAYIHANNFRSIINKFRNYFTARIQIKLFHKEETDVLKILSVSDDKAVVSQPKWYQRDGVGYVISSYVGNLKIVAKAFASGRMQVFLMGLDIRDEEDKSKRVPYWIDYTALTVNGKTILGTLTPAWHNKPYRYAMNAKAGDEITVEVEWLPHRSDT